jgi:hypothetical protein
MAGRQLGYEAQYEKRLDQEEGEKIMRTGYKRISIRKQSRRKEDDEENTSLDAKVRK